MQRSRSARHTRRSRFRRGFTLIEAMLMVSILSIVALGVGVGLQSTVHSPARMDTILAINNQIVSTMEQMKVNALNSFSTLAGYTDTVTINNTSYTRTVTVSGLTAPDGSGATTDYKQITVQIGNESMTTYVTQP